MTSTSRRLIQGVLTSAALFLMSCGDSEIQYVKNFNYSVSDNVVELEIEFNPDLSLNTELTVPILNYGVLSLIPNFNDQGLKINTKVSMDALVDQRVLSLDQTRDLPNGYPMSGYVETDVGELRLKASKDVTANIYFGLEENKFYLGSAIELSFISEDFPAGLVLTQRIRDNLGRMLGVVTFFGPKVEYGEIIKPGGIFFISNATDLAEYLEEYKENSNISSLSANDEKPSVRNISLMPEFKTDVNIKKYNRKIEQFNLFKLYKSKGRKAGLID